MMKKWDESRTGKLVEIMCQLIVGAAYGRACAMHPDLPVSPPKVKKPSNGEMLKIED